MRVGLVTNLVGKGLQLDAELLRDVLSDHSVDLIQYDQPYEGQSLDLLIFLEVVVPHLFPHAPRLWWIPNAEWTKPEMFGPARRFEKILAKTREAEETLRTTFDHVYYTGFLSRDRLDMTIVREKRFLHLGGDSGFKNTNAVIDAWRQWRYWAGDGEAELTLVSNSKTTAWQETSGVRFISRTSDEEIRHLQNSHLFHLFPSAYEGYGHALHEAQSVGAVVLTTDAAPMNEVSTPFKVPSISIKKNNLANLHTVSGRDIREKVTEMLAMDEMSIVQCAAEARAEWNGSQNTFRDAFLPLLRAGATVGGPKIPQIATRARIGILGNFEPEFSTENDLAWTLADMGYQVDKFQENGVQSDEILINPPALLIYIHTHGWTFKGPLALEDLWKELKRRGTKLCSFHLDKYWGLSAADHREDKIGQHPFWKIDCWTADGGNQDRFKERGVNHFWLPPGVSKKYCYRGVPRNEWKIDIGFVGARHYHGEYRFREELIGFLEGYYGDHFRVFTGYRGDDLNNLYASVGVLVGDSCFAGTAPRYWSDRYPESLGRGGFLVAPEIEGMVIPGFVPFEPGNLSQLQRKIDWWLDHPDERKEMTNIAMSWCRENETYHQRMQKILDHYGLA